MVNKLTIRPGQAWTWASNVGDGTWFLDIVTEEKRNNWAAAYTSVVIIQNGDTFIVVSTDDSGPIQSPLIMFDELCKITNNTNKSNKKRWHVVLTHGKLAWIEHDLFEYAKLVDTI